jgi:hypothetical protein
MNTPIAPCQLLVVGYCLFPFPSSDTYRLSKRQTITTIMGGAADSSAAMDAAAQMRKAALKGSSGMAGLVQNRKVFGIAMFACLGGYVHSLFYF